MLITAVIKNEALRNEQMIAQYEAQLTELPKGTLICRKNKYYYLKFRHDGKVRDVYIGKDPDKIAQVQEQLEYRKHCESMLSALRSEQKKINRIMEEFGPMSIK